MQHNKHDLRKPYSRKYKEQPDSWSLFKIVAFAVLSQLTMHHVSDTYIWPFTNESSLIESHKTLNLNICRGQL